MGLLISPHAGGLKGDGGDEPQRAVAIRKGADAASAARDLALEPLKAVGRRDASPMFTWEGVELGGGREALLQTAEGLGDLVAVGWRPVERPIVPFFSA